jgi:hypothetical protein
MKEANLGKNIDSQSGKSAKYIKRLAGFMHWL